MADYMKLSNYEKYRRIGLNIAHQRKLKKLTQVQLAERIGISRTHMSNIEAPNKYVYSYFFRSYLQHCRHLRNSCKYTIFILITKENYYEPNRPFYVCLYV